MFDTTKILVCYPNVKEVMLLISENDAIFLEILVKLKRLTFWMKSLRILEERAIAEGKVERQSCRQRRRQN